ncbi:hypothetical protein D3C78_1656980 [compost metagenome]
MNVKSCGLQRLRQCLYTSVLVCTVQIKLSRLDVDRAVVTFPLPHYPVDVDQVIGVSGANLFTH